MFVRIYPQGPVGEGLTGKILMDTGDNIRICFITNAKIGRFLDMGGLLLNKFCTFAS